jgi:hypothetical protein
MTKVKKSTPALPMTRRPLPKSGVIHWAETLEALCKRIGLPPPEREYEESTDVAPPPITKQEIFANLFNRFDSEAHKLSPSLANDLFAFLWMNRPPMLTVPEQRWMTVCYFRDQTETHYKDMFKRAEDLLAGTDAAAAASTIRGDYEKWENSLPPELKYQRTYRPKS